MNFLIPEWLIFVALWFGIGLIVIISGLLFVALTFKLTRTEHLYAAWHCYFHVRFRRAKAWEEIRAFVYQNAKQMREANPAYAETLAKALIGAGPFDTLIKESPGEWFPRLVSGEAWLSPTDNATYQRMRYGEVMSRALPGLGKPTDLPPDHAVELDGHIFILRSRSHEDGRTEFWWEMKSPMVGSDFISSSWMSPAVNFTPASTPL